MFSNCHPLPERQVHLEEVPVESQHCFLGYIGQITSMPLYEYHCLDCDQDMELLVSSSSEKPECPECGSSNMEKQFSTFAAGGSPAIDVSSGCCSGGGCGCASPGPN